MKKMIALLLLVVTLATLLTACGRFECNICKEKKFGKRYESSLLGQEIVVCKDCYEGLQKGLEGLVDAFKK